MSEFVDGQSTMDIEFVNTVGVITLTYSIGGSINNGFYKSNVKSLADAIKAEEGNTIDFEILSITL